MKYEPLSVMEALRYANHDFMNHLQLLNINLDMGRLEESKEYIQQISEKYKSISQLTKLKLPLTVEWLITASWRFSAIELTITSNITCPNETQKDQEIVGYLEKTIQSVYKGLDPYTAHQLFIHVESTENLFRLTFHLTGKWDEDIFIDENLQNVKVQVFEKTNESWKFELS